MDIQELNLDIDVMKAILWQYNDAEKYQAILQAKQDWQEANNVGFSIDWIADVFDIRTANEFGLSVWSIILDIPIIIQAQQPSEVDIVFGMNEDDDGNFENSNFKPDGFTPQILGVDEARQVIMLRYFQLTSNGTVSQINGALYYLYKDKGDAYVIDNYDMTMTYIFGFALSSSLMYIFNNYDVLPRPAGVRIADINIIGSIPFGFNIYNKNFDNGNFEE